MSRPPRARTPGVRRFPGPRGRRSRTSRELSGQRLPNRTSDKREYRPGYRRRDRAGNHQGQGPVPPRGRAAERRVPLRSGACAGRTPLGTRPTFSTGFRARRSSPSPGWCRCARPPSKGLPSSVHRNGLAVGTPTMGQGHLATTSAVNRTGVLEGDSSATSRAIGSARRSPDREGVPTAPGSSPRCGILIALRQHSLCLPSARRQAARDGPERAGTPGDGRCRRQAVCARHQRCSGPGGDRMGPAG